MDVNDLKDLIRQPEGLKLEFKRELYYINHIESEVQNREWGEFIKDLMALANGNVGTLGQNGYLIIGVGDRRRPDGTRNLFGISEFLITSKQLLEKLNTYSAPPFADLTVETLLLDGYRILVITIPPSPHLHETTKRLQTRKSVFSEHTVFIRRSEHIFPASANERAAIAAEKSELQRRLEAMRQTEPPLGTHSPRPQLVDSYLRSTIANEQELDHLYIDLSGETQQIRLMQTGFPRGLIPNEFRVIDLEKDPQSQIYQHLNAIDEAIGIHNRFVLLGAPGSGKTVTLRKLLLDTARRALMDSEKRIPVLIDLAHWPEKIHDVPELLAYECQLKGLGNIHFGQLLVLFDGLNEMPAETYAERINLLEEWLQVNSSAFVVISCRERDYRENERLSLPTVQVYPLDESRIKRLLHAYLGEQSAEDLIRQLRPEDVGRRSARDLIHLASNPYMLTMIAYVYKKNFGELPNSRGQLFQLFVKTLFRREEEHGTTEGFSYEELVEGLGSIAFAMQARWSATAVETMWAAKQVPRGIRTSQLWLIGVRASLVHFADEDRVVQFSHQLLLEYFAAEGLLKKPSGLNNLKKPSFKDSKRRVSRWDEVIYTLTGITDPDQLLTKISSIDPFLAADCLAHVPGKIAVAESTKGRILDELCNLFTSDNSQAKQAAIARIAELGEPTIPTLLGILEHGNQIAKRAVLNVFSKIGGSAVARGFVLALTDKKKWVRRDAIDYLEYLVPPSDSEVGLLVVDYVLKGRRDGSKELLQAFSYFCSLDNLSCLERTVQLLIEDEGNHHFINMILTTNNGRIFQSVFQTLFLSLQFFTDTKFQRALVALDTLALAFRRRFEASLTNRTGNKTPADIEWLIQLPQMASAFEDPKVRNSALEITRTLVNSIAMASLRVEMSSSIDSVVKDFIEAQTIQAPKSDSPQKTSSEAQTENADLLRRLIWELGDPNVVVGRRAGEQLVRIGKPAVELLIKALQSPNTALRRRAPRVLAKIGSNAAIQPLTKLLSDSNVPVRLGAVKALAQIGDASVVQDLLPLLEDEASEVRFNAVLALNHCGDDDLIQDLIPSLKDPDEWVVIETSRVLLSWGYAPANDFLTLIMTNGSNSFHRLQAIRVLGRHGGTRAADSLIEVLRSKHESEIVALVATALGELGDKSAVAPLINVLSSDDIRVRRTVSAVLGTFDCPETVGALITSLADSDDTVRLNAINGLSSFKNSTALEALSTSLFNSDPAVRKHSAKVLGRLGDWRAVAPLMQATSDASDDTLDEILRALGQLGAFGRET